MMSPDDAAIVVIELFVLPAGISVKRGAVNPYLH